MPLIAVLKHAHQSLPVSLVSISPEGSVATGSHEGSIQHYMLTPPACTSKTDSRLRSMFEKGVGDRSEQCASEGVGRSEGQEAAGSRERAAHDVLDSMQILSLDERPSYVHSDQQPSALSEVMYSELSPLVTALFLSSEQSVLHILSRVYNAHKKPKPLREETTISSLDKSAHRQVPCTQVDALLLANVERVSALTVIDSEQQLPGPSGRADRILSGFQVSFKEC